MHAKYKGQSTPYLTPGDIYSLNDGFCACVCEPDGDHTSDFIHLEAYGHDDLHYHNLRDLIRDWEILDTEKGSPKDGR